MLWCEIIFTIVQKSFCFLWKIYRGADNDDSIFLFCHGVLRTLLRVCACNGQSHTRWWNAMIFSELHFALSNALLHLNESYSAERSVLKCGYGVLLYFIFALFECFQSIWTDYTCVCVCVCVFLFASNYCFAFGLNYMMYISFFKWACVCVRISTSFITFILQFSFQRRLTLSLTF